MRHIQFKALIFSLFILVLTSCLGDDDTTATSSDYTFVSLTFAKNDSIPKLETAVFTLVGDTIVNLDSLPYKTRIDSVNPTFKFKSTSNVKLNDNTYLTGKDTIDFSSLVTIENWASDEITHKKYYVKVNVHKVQPELYLWSKTEDNTDVSNATSQTAIVLNNKIFYYLSNGTNMFLRTSENGFDWQTETLSNLPNSVRLREMVNHNEKLYLLLNGTQILISTDGISWSASTCSPTGYTYSPLLVSLNKKLWAIAKSTSTQKSYFANSTDGITWEIVESAEVPSAFPVSDFSALSFRSRTGKPTAIVVGGYDGDHTLLKNVWSTENGEYWVDFSREKKSLDSLSLGASMIAYDSKLLLFGVVTRTNGTTASYYRQSIDEGYTWSVPDTAYNKLPASYGIRNYQSVVVYKPVDADKSYNANRIFMLGGKTSTQTVTDCWTGKLNRKCFTRN